MWVFDIGYQNIVAFRSFRSYTRFISMMSLKKKHCCVFRDIYMKQSFNIFNANSPSKYVKSVSL